MDHNICFPNIVILTTFDGNDMFLKYPDDHPSRYLVANTTNDIIAHWLSFYPISFTMVSTIYTIYRNVSLPKD